MPRRPSARDRAEDEARLLEALAATDEPRPRRGLLLNRASELAGSVAAALDGHAADTCGAGATPVPTPWRPPGGHATKAVVVNARDLRSVLRAPPALR